MKKKYLLILISLWLIAARNPFEPIVTPWDKPLDAKSLKQYSFSDLTLQAIVWDTDKKLCLFKTTDGKTFIASPGTAIGKNGGKVSQIGDNIVVIKGPLGEVTFKIKE